MLDAKQELRAHEHGGQGHLDARLEASIGARVPVERERALDVGVRHRAPGIARRISDARICFARIVPCRARRLREKNPAAARRVARPFRRMVR